MRENRIDFFKNASGAAESGVMPINKANTLTIEVSGTGTFSIEVLATVGVSQESFSALQGIKLNDFSVVSAISTTGIYEYDVTGISKVKVNLASMSGGNITITGVSRGDY